MVLTEEKKSRGVNVIYSSGHNGKLTRRYVHSANLHDTVMGIMPAITACSLYPSIQKFCGDQGYRKTFEEDAASFLGIEVEISEKITPNKFHILPKR